MNACGTTAEASDVPLPPWPKTEIPSVYWRATSHCNLACDSCCVPMREDKADFGEVMDAARLIAKEPAASLKLATVVSRVNPQRHPLPGEDFRRLVEEVVSLAARVLPTPHGWG